MTSTTTPTLAMSVNVDAFDDISVCCDLGFAPPAQRNRNTGFHLLSTIRLPSTSQTAKRKVPTTTMDMPAGGIVVGVAVDVDFEAQVEVFHQALAVGRAVAPPVLPLVPIDELRQEATSSLAHAAQIERLPVLSLLFTHTAVALVGDPHGCAELGKVSDEHAAPHAWVAGVLVQRHTHA